MVKVVVDSSVVIEKIRTGSGLYDELIDLMSKDKISLFIPVIVIAELWAGFSMKHKDAINVAELLIREMQRINMVEESCKMAGEMVRKYDIKPMDALIAASTMGIGARLITHNLKDFEKVKGLKLYKIKKESVKQY